MKNSMFMKFWIKLTVIGILFLSLQPSFSQDLVINDRSIDAFIQDILKDKRLEFVYSRRGYLFSDFLMLAEDQKIVSVYRNNGKIISNGTPILFLDSKNLQLDSLFFNSWPPFGTPNTFNPLSELDGSLLFFPNSVYKSKSNFPDLKKPTRGFVQNFNFKERIQFKNLSSSNQLLLEYFKYDDKKRILNSKNLKKSFSYDSILYRYTNSKIAIFDGSQEVVYFLDRLNDFDILSYDLSNNGLINFEIFDNESIVFCSRNKKTNKFEIRTLNVITGESEMIYESIYYIPRVKVFNHAIYFEIASKFSDSEYAESIIFEINL